MKLRLFGLVNDSIVDGPGLRYTIFTQGCSHVCLGCHNPGSHDYNAGYLKDSNEIVKDIDQNSLLDGVTFSGGEPMEQAEACYHLAKEIAKRGLHIIIYSGYTFEELLKKNDPYQMAFLQQADVLIDGRFVQELRSLALLFKGSKNQRILNVKASLEKQKAIEYTINEYGEFVER